jgi:hypothetical protein
MALSLGLACMERIGAWDLDSKEDNILGGVLEFVLAFLKIS